jgi:hypothetical protein
MSHTVFPRKMRGKVSIRTSEYIQSIASDEQTRRERPLDEICSVEAERRKRSDPHPLQRRPEMPNFDGTTDNRWRPDHESSQRRIREEEQDHQKPAVYSRELWYGSRRALRTAGTLPPTRLARTPRGASVEPPACAPPIAWLFAGAHSSLLTPRSARSTGDPSRPAPVGWRHSISALSAVLPCAAHSGGQLYRLAPCVDLHGLADRRVQANDQRAERVVDRLGRDLLRFDLLRLLIYPSADLLDVEPVQPNLSGDRT